MSTGPALPERPPLTLSVREHTREMRLLMADPERVAARLRARSVRAADRFDPPALRHVRELPGALPDLRVALDALLEAGPRLDAARGRVPADLRAAADRLAARVRATHGPAAKLALLRRLGGEADVRDRPALAAGVAVAAGILEDGLDSVYSPRRPFHRELGARAGRSLRAHREQTTGERPPTEDDVADKDARGAFEGAALGGATGAGIGIVFGNLPGAGGGAIVVAIYESGGKIVDVIGDWWGGITGLLDEVGDAAIPSLRRTPAGSAPRPRAGTPRRRGGGCGPPRAGRAAGRP